MVYASKVFGGILGLFLGEAISILIGLGGVLAVLLLAAGVVFGVFLSDVVTGRALHSRVLRSKIKKLFSNRLFSFSFSLASAVCATAIVVLILIEGWSILTFNPNSLANEYAVYASQTGNSTAQNIALYILTAVQGATALKSGFMVFLPLMAVCASMLFLASFYLISKRRENVMLGAILCVIFGLSGIIGLIVALPIVPIYIVTLFNFLGTTGQNIPLYATVSYLLFVSYLILAVCGSLFGFYRANYMSVE